MKISALAKGIITQKVFIAKIPGEREAFLFMTHQSEQKIIKNYISGNQLFAQKRG